MAGYAWTTTNAVGSLAAAAFTWASGPSDDTRLYMRDGRMGKQFTCTTANGGNTLYVDFGTATSLKGWALLNHNLASFGGTVSVQIQGADDAGFTTNVVTAKDVTTLDFTAPHAKDHVLQFAAVSRRHWRLVFTWTGDKVFKVGEVFAYASATALTRRDNYGSGEGHEYRLASVESDNMEERSYLLAGPRRTKRLVFGDRSEAERAELEALFYAAKASVNPVLFILSQNEVSTAAAAVDTDVMFGKLADVAFDFEFSDYSRNNAPTLVLRNLAREVGA